MNLIKINTLSFFKTLTILMAAAFIFAACSEEIEYPEGLDVTDETRGSGKTAEEGDFLIVHYTGSLVESGDVFDSSHNRGVPFHFRLGEGNVIQGWDKGLVGMRVGGKRTLVMDSSLGYGESGAGNAIPPNADLKFEIELVDIVKNPKPWSYRERDVVELESGLRYVVIEEGEGEPAIEGDVLDVHYAGFLEDGTLFDASARTPDSFRLELGTGMVIQGWEQGLKGMKEGEHRLLIIPSDLAYGERGAGDVIPPNATLIFNVELERLERY